MGALAPWHWAVLIVVILFVFGGRILPRLGRSFGQSLTGVKKGLKEGSEGFKSAISDEKEPSKAAAEAEDGEARGTKEPKKDV
jgi:sec-independent protein translocase protein TatA